MDYNGGGLPTERLSLCHNAEVATLRQSEGPEVEHLLASKPSKSVSLCSATAEAGKEAGAEAKEDRSRIAEWLRRG